MSRRRGNRKRISQLLAGSLGLAVLFAGTAFPVAAAEPTDTSIQPGPQTAVASHGGLVQPASSDNVTSSAAASPDPSPIASPDAIPEPVAASVAPSPAALEAPGPDTTPPALAGLDITTVPSSASAVVTLTFHVTDDSSGFAIG